MEGMNKDRRMWNILMESLKQEREKMYTKEEVLTKFSKFLDDLGDTECMIVKGEGRYFDRHLIPFDIDKWIKENLK